ncbi:glycosyltransferase [Argonema antarcticum]|uniref:glycosyltransferase n=1 Tax=Argonema antarcticum TaxID=2942763 RepID=UPI002011C958|nr:glycosyltransferase [Argonema antarcticum]MCL1475061.1 glycosyltransferase [Argonema antarcticum A004/B2]
MIIGEIGLGITFISLVIWVVLLCFRGQFWQADQRLDVPAKELEKWPSVCAVIPARNEAEMLPATMRSALLQSYPGSFKIVLVDDNSTDNTANVAQNVAQELDKSQQLHILSGEPLPPGWSGKLWAIEQGIRYAETLTPTPDYFLLTDADIEHHSTNLRQLVAKSQQDDLDLVSLMVLLRCESFWEKALIPAFVFFFQKLYPFRWVNNPKNSTAAAAGGCILIRSSALNRVGGIEVVRQALIDDCALAQAVKNRRGINSPANSESPLKWNKSSFSALFRGIQLLARDLNPWRVNDPIENFNNNQQPNIQGKIWLGLTNLTRSLRPYPSLSSIWDMVARTAFTQLNYSPLLLLGTLIGMTLIYIVPPVGAIVGLLTGNWLVALVSLSTWLLMAIAYLPTLKLYGCSSLWSFCLPAIAFLYTLMTLDSAWRHWRGQGGAWKGRVYSLTGITTKPIKPF